MSYRLAIEIPSLPPLPNRVRGAHWTTERRVRQDWQLFVQVAVGRSKPAAPLEHARLVLTRRSAVEPDGDNLRASWKPVIDALKGLVIRDDGPDVLPQGAVEYRWEKAKRGCGGVRMEIFSRSAQNGGS